MENLYGCLELYCFYSLKTRVENSEAKVEIDQYYDDKWVWTVYTDKQTDDEASDVSRQ